MGFLLITLPDDGRFLVVNMQQQLFKVRDRRNRGWFWLDNEYLNGYAKVFGPIGTAIYLSLCRHADIEQKCFPSQKLIGEELNISDRIVREYLKWFVKCRIISVEKQRRGGKFLNNVYALLDREEWEPPEECSSYGTRGTKRPSPEERGDIHQRNVVPTKKTHSKNTNIRKEKKLFKTFNYGAYKKELTQKMGWR